MCARGDERRKGELGVIFEGKWCMRAAHVGREVHAASPWPRELATLCLMDDSAVTII